jgi:hypothetical protein
MWNEKYHEAAYQLNGDAKYNKYDCTSSIYWILKDLKSNFPLLAVADMQKYLEIVSSKRKGFYDVQIKDLIVMYVRGAYHIAMVEGKKGNTIQYLDVNVADDGAGYKTIAFDNAYIKGVYPITFELWIGDLLKNIKDVNKK